MHDDAVDSVEHEGPKLVPLLAARVPQLQAARSGVSGCEINQPVTCECVGYCEVGASAFRDELLLVFGAFVAVAEDDTVRRRHDATAKGGAGG